MSIYSRLDRIAADVEKLNKQVKSVSNAPQSQRTSVEGGSIDFNDADGNLQAIVGGQDDGSNTIRHVDGPTPPIPSGLTAHVDGPIIQVTWDGVFEDAAGATFDWSHLEVVAVGPSNEQLRGTISDVTGASNSLAATVSGEWTVVARSVSRAEKRSLDGDAGTVEVEIVGLSGAIEDAIGSANGKNTVTYSETPPASEDEGIDGDTWFVNTFDVETPIMLITEQWQFLDGAWVQTELDHEVIATIDAGKITVGELDGIRIMGKTVRGEQLSGDAIDGMVITGGTYRTSGGSGEWSDDGLFITQPDGTSMVRFPTDGSPLSLTASDVQIERASVGELDMVNGAVRSGGTFSLAAGVTAPPSPPELTTGWQKVASLPAPPERADANGLAYWGNGDGFWVRAVNVLGTGEGDRIELYDSTTGGLADSFPIGLDPRHGITVIGDIVYIFGKDHDVKDPRLFIFGYNMNTGARTSRHEYTRNVSAQNALGNDGTNLIVASIYNRELWVHRRNPVTGVQVGPDMRSGSNSWNVSNTDLFGVSITGSTVQIVHLMGARGYSISGGVLTLLEGANSVGWGNPNKNGAGMVMMVGRFGVPVPFMVDGAGNVYEGSQFASDTSVLSHFTWFDGTHETTASPTSSTTFRAREALVFSLPARAGMQKRLYFKFGTGAWNRVTLPEALTTVSWMDMLNYSPVSAEAPTTSTFPVATPAVLKSNIGGFQVKGDGSGTWGPLTFNADGTMTSTAIPAWVPVTTFINGAGPQTFGHAPAYRIWPDGKVEWRGVVVFPSGTGVEFLTVPVAARPSHDVHWVCATNSSNPGVTKMDICDPTAPTVMRITASSNRVWCSLDGVHYYLT